MIYLFITFLIFIVLLFLIFKIFSKLIHIIIASILLLLFIGSGLTFAVYYDFKNFNENFYSSENIILLEKDGEYLAGGIYILNNTDNILQESLDPTNFNSKSYKEILGDNYKLIIINESFIIENIDDNTYIKEYNLNKNDIINKISDFKNQDFETRTNIFSILLYELLSKKGSTIFIDGYRDSEIIIYKEPFFLKFINIIS